MYIPDHTFIDFGVIVHPPFRTTLLFGPLEYLNSHVIQGYLYTRQVGWTIGLQMETPNTTLSSAKFFVGLKNVKL